MRDGNKKKAPVQATRKETEPPRKSEDLGAARREKVDAVACESCSVMRLKR